MKKKEQVKKPLNKLKLKKLTIKEVEVIKGGAPSSRRRIHRGS